MNIFTFLKGHTTWHFTTWTKLM